MSDQTASALFYLLILILPLSALIARRVPIGPTLRMALIWGAIFLIALLLVAQRDRLARWTAPVREQVFGAVPGATGATVRVPMAADGHFWVTARVNGVSRRMLVDSGASTTALSTASTRAAGVDAGGSPFPVMIDTANGTVAAQSATAASLDIDGLRVENLPVIVVGSSSIDVIGMIFLSRLGGWRVEGRTLLLTPKHQ